MKVLVIIRGRSLKRSGGAERRFIRLLNYLNDPSIKLVTNKEFAESIFESGLVKNKDLIIHPPHKMSSLSFNFWLMKSMKISKPDIIHLVLIQKSLFPFYTWLNFFHKQVIVVSTIAWTRYLNGAYTRLPDIILGNYIWMRAQMIDLLYPSGVRSKWLVRYRHKISITPCSFTDYELFKPTEDKENIVSFIGRLVPEKNPILFLESILKLKTLYPQIVSDWKFVIMGKGRLEGKVRQFINKYSLNQMVELASSYSSHELLSKLKIFVSLQYPTNYPSQSLIEAMASGNAVIATDDVDTRSLVNSTNGILIPKDADELAKSLILLMENKNLRKNLGKQARETVLQGHRLDIFANYMVSLWQEVLSFEKI